MSRKARQVAEAVSSGTYASARCLAANLGYSPIKPRKLPPDVTIVLWLPESSTAAQPGAFSGVGPILPAVQRVLTDTTGKVSPPGAIFIVDCTPLVPAGKSARNIIDKEETGGQLGKQLGKPVGRMLEKLICGHRGSINLVGVDFGAALVLGLLKVSAAEHGIREGTIDRVVLLRPKVSAAVVNAQLTVGSQAVSALDVIYESSSALERRDAAVRHVYPRGRSRVLDCLSSSEPAALGGALYSSLLSDDTCAGPPAADVYGALVDPDASDVVGQTVFWAEVTFEMNRDSKQLEAVVVDVDTAEIAHAAALAARAARAREPPATPAATPAAVPTGGGASSSSAAVASSAALGPMGHQQPALQQQVGVLILRGNRCVLVRSLESPPAWQGMRIPTVPLRPGEEGVDGAIRAAAEFCDIADEWRESELERVPSVPPACLFLDGGGEEPQQALIYTLYAARPPPPGALEDADLTDEDDTYDWYTWPRAVHALRHDARAIATLRTLACAVGAAVSAGRLPSKWGGYFGQEWLGPPASTSAPPLAPALLQASTAALPPPAAGRVQQAAQAPSAGAVAGHEPSPREVAQRLASLEAKMDVLLASLAGGGGRRMGVGAPSHEAPSAPMPPTNEGTTTNVAAGALSLVQEAASVLGDAAPGSAPLLPVTVLSGFLGAGKTTLLTHLLHNSAGYRIAIIVNDMASINIDAELVRRADVMQQEEKMVELSNGCICCTLREDLLTSLAALAAERRFDHVLVESSGISEPIPVAETFTFKDEATGVSLADVASLHNLVTVVDAAAIFEQLGSMDSLADRGWQAGHGDERTVSQLLCEQLEFADVLVVNKVDLLREEQLASVERLIQKINPGAEVIRTSRSRIEPSLLLEKARFSLRQAEEHPAWLSEARENEHTPETIEYGISSFIYRAKCPFHPERLHAALGIRPRPGALDHLLRLKGIAWIATRHGQQACAALAGTQFCLAPGPPWWAAIDRDLWPEGLWDDIKPLWHEEHGDRQSELVCIGQELDHEAARAALDACVLTDDEMARGAEAWAALPDPFAKAWDLELLGAAEHQH